MGRYYALKNHFKRKKRTKLEGTQEQADITDNILRDTEGTEKEILKFTLQRREKGFKRK